MELLALPGMIGMVLSVVLLVVKGFAMADAAMRPTEAFPAADKQTKPFWLIILGLGLVGSFVFMDGLSLISIIATVAALVYLAGVRPAVREIGGQNRRSEGPYGPW